MNQKTNIRLATYMVYVFFGAAVILTAFSLVRHTTHGWMDVLAQETESQKQNESGFQESGMVLGSFTALFISPTPTPTNTPTPTPTLTPSPTPTPTYTPTPTPVPPTATPTPTPLPTRVPASPAEIDEFFQRFSQEFGVEEEILRKIAYCESGYNAQSVNGPYGGMYQFHHSSWESTRNAMGADPNHDLRFNPEEAIRTAAFKISAGGIGAWPACSR